MAVVGGRFYGDIPEIGAIFMSNKSTKDECFDRKIFGLPLSCANFVKNVKAGMLLFLFEYERRNLYGVFEATSDGGLNIIPQAYHSSGKSCPAQVRFRVVWSCRPLSENCFRDAIRDNYYAANKFRFGLSMEQVQKLLLLFDSSRSIVQKPLVFMKSKRRSIKSSDRKMDFATAQISENSSEHGFTAQISNNSSSGSLLIQLQTGPECKNTSDDSWFLEDYIPLSDSEHCDRVSSDDGSDRGDFEDHPKVKRLYSDTQQSDDGSDRSEFEDQPKVKRLYSDTQQKQRSVFSRLQYDVKAVPQHHPGENSRMNRNHPSHHLQWDSESSSFEEESERKSEVPQSVQKIMKKLEWGQWMVEDKTPSRKASVFSRISFPPEVHMYDRELNTTYNASYLVEANKNAKKRNLHSDCRW